MTKSHEERILFAQTNDMPMDFVDWFFDNKAPAISSSMVLCAAAFMYEGWKGRKPKPVGTGIITIDSPVVNDASWKLHNALSEEGPLTAGQFIRLKTAFYDSLSVVLDALPDDDEVVVTRNDRGDIVAVTRQDGEGRVIEVIAESNAPPVPEEMTGDGVLAMHDCGYIEGWNACRAAMTGGVK